MRTRARVSIGWTVLVLAAWVASTAFAATYYVNPSSGDDENDGSSGSPWATIDRAFPTFSGDTPVVTNGDTVYLLTGSYGEWDLDNWTGTSYITYEVPDGQTATFEKVSITNSSQSNAYLKLIGLLDYTVEFDVYRTDAPLKPFAIQEEVPLELNVLGEDSEHWKLNQSILAKAYKRMNVGYARWEYAAHATLST